MWWCKHRDWAYPWGDTGHPLKALERTTDLWPCLVFPPIGTPVTSSNFFGFLTTDIQLFSNKQLIKGEDISNGVLRLLSLKPSGWQWKVWSFCFQTFPTPDVCEFELRFRLRYFLWMFFSPRKITSLKCTKEMCKNLWKCKQITPFCTWM